MIPGSVPVAIKTTLPTRTDGNDLRIFVRPGKHVVTIETVLASMPSSIAAPKVDPKIFDAQEVWIWRPNDELQSVELTGLTAIDPERTALPEEWQNQTTFLAAADDALTLNVKRRGVTETAPNAINVSREFWLDLDGNGYTVRDQITGTMQRGWRLGYQNIDNANLGRVSAGNDGMLITTDPKTSTSGVEIRDAALNLTAELRLEDVRRDLHIVGWDHDVQSLSGTLHLPPGWSVIHGSGVDRIENTWVSSWTLWDLFFIFVIVLGFFQLLGVKWASIAFITLLLTHGHAAAPEWSWIHLIVSLALLRVLPSGIWRRIVVVYRASAFIVFAVLLAMYANEQVMSGLFPQAANQFSSVGSFSGLDDSKQEAPDRFVAAVEAPEEIEEEKSIGWSRDVSYSGKKTGGEKARQQEQLQQVDPNAVVQTGPGVPDWTWNSWQLEWTGPVRKDQKATFWLLSSWMNRALSFLRVILLFLLAFGILSIREMTWNGGKKKGAAAVALISMICFALPLSAESPAVETTIHAEELPHQNDLLQKLRNRMIARADCPNPCVVVSELSLDLSGSSLTVTADVHAQQDAGLFLPGPLEVFSPNSVTLNGTSSVQLRREPGGLTALRIPKGTHRLVVIGQLAAREVVTLQFDPNSPAEHVSFRSSDWAADGLSEAGVAEGSLQLTRTQRSNENKTEEGSELPPWFLVNRNFAIGLPWQIETRVQREDSTRPQLLRFPLLKDERVISEGFRVEEGEVIVELPRGVDSTTFVSEISIRPTIELKAAKGKPWTERWAMECSRIWRCEHEGVPVYDHTSGGTYRPRFFPWPGEELKISINRPEGVSGTSSTVTRVDYDVTPGSRLLLGSLTLAIRASQGGWQKVTLPAKSELQSVQIDGAAAAIRPVDDVVSLPLKPGEQTIVLRWQQPWERGIFETAPKVDIGSDSVNVRTTIRRGDDRWVLWGSLSPGWGPAVLFWPRLIIMLLIAIALGRFRNLPLKTPHWMILVVGLSQLHPAFLIPIVFWFLIIRERKQRPLENNIAFDTLQIAIPFFTLITLAVLYAAVHTNLLIDIDMQVRGGGSSNSIFRWYIDQSSSVLPQPTIITVSQLVWRIAMLVWAVWLVYSLFKWAPWGWRSFTDGGAWKPLSNPRRAATKKTREPTPTPPIADSEE